MEMEILFRNEKPLGNETSNRNEIRVALGNGNENGIGNGNGNETRNETRNENLHQK